MSHKLLWRQTSKGKSRSVYIITHLKANLEVYKNTAHLDNPIFKVTIMKAIYLMNIMLKDPPMHLRGNLMRSISISTHPCREALIQPIVGSPILILNLKPSWPLS